MQAKGIKNQESVVDISKTGIQKSELCFINALKGRGFSRAVQSREECGL